MCATGEGGYQPESQTDPDCLKPPQDEPGRDKPGKLLPDMKEIDLTVQVYKEFGLKLTAILDKIQEDGGITIKVKPDGPIEVSLSGLEIHVPLTRGEL